jgi:hypothetical protein
MALRRNPAIVRRMAKPRPPEEILRAVLSFLLSLFTGGLLGLGMGLFIIVGGVMEIAGYRRLRRRDPDGMKLLVNSQLVVLGAIWAWALPSLLSFDPSYLRDDVIPNVREMLAASGMNLDALLVQAGLGTDRLVPLVRLFLVVLYGSVMLATLLYQGGMVLYYRHRTAAVTEALRMPLPPEKLAALLAAAGPAAEAPPLLAIEQRFYDAVGREMARNDLKPGLWARALAETGADDGRARARYIRLRVADLQAAERAGGPAPNAAERATD